MKALQECRNIIEHLHMLYCLMRYSFIDALIDALDDRCSNLLHLLFTDSLIVTDALIDGRCSNLLLLLLDALIWNMEQIRICANFLLSLISGFLFYGFLINKL
ncbi:hypothetical protein HanOQP8_Chr13g0476391 [Helianthus annuus]|nr:hypothetical protein HanOQP8_Chr13g0476391 [Helianthus annuus]